MHAANVGVARRRVRKSAPRPADVHQRRGVHAGSAAPGEPNSGDRFVVGLQLFWLTLNQVGGGPVIFYIQVESDTSCHHHAALSDSPFDRGSCDNVKGVRFHNNGSVPGELRSVLYCFVVPVRAVCIRFRRLKRKCTVKLGNGKGLAGRDAGEPCARVAL